MASSCWEAARTCVAFAAGLMYLAQMRRLKSKRPARLGLTLPSLEQSERVNRGAITIAFPLLTFGLLIGMILSVNPGASGPKLGFTLSWTDPKVVSALGHVAGLRRASAAPVPAGLAGRSVMVLTIVAFAFLVFTWVGIEALRRPTAHGAARTAGGRR